MATGEHNQLHQFVAGGDLFAAPAEVLVNPVNCVGIMGKGLAFAFRHRFPANFAAYAAVCGRSELRPGGLVAHELTTTERMPGSPARWVVNLATKDHWRDPSQLAWVESGLRALRTWAEAQAVTSIALPALGAGLGGLPWPPVRAAIDATFAGSSLQLFIHPPRETTPAASPHRPGSRRG